AAIGDGGAGGGGGDGGGGGGAGSAIAGAAGGGGGVSTPASCARACAVWRMRTAANVERSVFILASVHPEGVGQRAVGARAARADQRGRRERVAGSGGARRDDDAHVAALDRPLVRRHVPVLQILHAQRQRDSLRVAVHRVGVRRVAPRQADALVGLQLLQRPPRRAGVAVRDEQVHDLVAGALAVV